MNWGNKLLLVFVVFAGLMATLVYSCMQENFELVSANYYNEELRFQEKIDGSAAANQLSKVQVQQSPTGITLVLPTEMKGLEVQGDLLFYCGSNSKNDRKFTLQVDEHGTMLVDRELLAAAPYVIQLKWQAGGQSYYHEQNISIP